MEKLHPVMKEILVSAEELDQKSQELGKLISDYYKNKGLDGPLVLLGLLKGCVPFMANLMKYITVPVITEYMVVTSYANNSVSSGEPQILLDVNQNIKDREVLIVEDIIDTGNTLVFVQNHIKNRGALDVKIVTMLNKPDRREATIDVDWIGRDIPDYFVVGYGLDYAQRFRNLPYVASVDLEKFDGYDWDGDFKNLK